MTLIILLLCLVQEHPCSAFYTFHNLVHLYPSSIPSHQDACSVSQPHTHTWLPIQNRLLQFSAHNSSPTLLLPASLHNAAEWGAAVSLQNSLLYLDSIVQPSLASCVPYSEFLIFWDKIHILKQFTYLNMKFNRFWVTDHQNPFPLFSSAEVLHPYAVLFFLNCSRSDANLPIINIEYRWNHIFMVSATGSQWLMIWNIFFVRLLAIWKMSNKNLIQILKTGWFAEPLSFLLISGCMAL